MHTHRPVLVANFLPRIIYHHEQVYHVGLVLYQMEPVSKFKIENVEIDSPVFAIDFPVAFYSL